MSDLNVSQDSISTDLKSADSENPVSDTPVLHEESATFDTVALVEQTTLINAHLDKVESLMMVCIVGLGLAIGVFCANIFSLYVRG